MTEIVVTLENNADENLLRQMIENMKGVLKTTLTHHKAEFLLEETENNETQLIESLHSIKDSIDRSVIDFSDPRTNYIMSK